MKLRPKQIWVDADACPKAVKELVFKTSFRLNVPVMLVANSYLAIPHSDLIRLIIVDKGADVADQYIIDHAEKNDLVITADIPLASKVVEKEAVAINPRGEIYTEENIGEILSMRDFMKELRDGGSITGGPAAFGPKDVQQFANSLNKLLS
ncbi:MAG: YaiI/YqxD family protein [Bdellovibrionales bacterium]|nr:YaiI/YqxD family protein [Bdellovibrionales bacterium]